jgi:hypothetical protein
MKYQIRKAEQYTVWQATEVANLDPEDFKNLEENPYTGDSEEEFLKYIAEFINTCRWDGFPSDLNSAATKELDKMVENVNWTEYHNSSFDGEESWYEIGEADESYRKSGGFNSRFDTIQNTNTDW